jgi:hypothetical protein
MHKNITLGIFVRSNSALEKKIKQPNAIIAVDTDIYFDFSIAEVRKIIGIVRKQACTLLFFINLLHEKIFMV